MTQPPLYAAISSVIGTSAYPCRSRALSNLMHASRRCIVRELAEHMQCPVCYKMYLLKLHVD